MYCIPKVITVLPYFTSLFAYLVPISSPEVYIWVHVLCAPVVINCVFNSLSSAWGLESCLFLFFLFFFFVSSSPSSGTGIEHNHWIFHSFIKQILIEYLLCAGHLSKWWRYRSKQNRWKFLIPWRLYFCVGH